MSGTDGHDREPGRRDPRGGRARGRRVPCDGLAGRQRVPRVSPDVRARRRGRHPPAGLHPEPRRPVAWSPAAATRSPSSSPSRPAACSPIRSSRASCAASAGALAAASLQLRAADAGAQRRAAHRRATSPAATSTARCSSASTATTRSRRRSRRAASRSCSSGGRPQGADVSYVDVDNRQGGAARDAHLLEQGARRVATIAGPDGHGRGHRPARGLPRRHPRRTATTSTRRSSCVGDFTLRGRRGRHGAPARVRARPRRPCSSPPT